MWKSYKWILSKICKYSSASMLGEILCIVLAGILQPLLTFVLQNMVDAVSGVRFALACLLALFYVLGLNLQGLTASFRAYMKASVHKNVGNGLQQEIVQKFSRIDYWVFEDRECRDVLQQIAVKPYEQLLNVYEHSLDMIRNAFSFAGLLWLLSQMGGIIPISFGLLSALNMYLSYRAMSISSNLSYDQTSDEREMDYLAELLQNKSTLAELKLFGSVRYIVDLWKKQSDTVLKYRLKMTVKSQMLFLSGGILTIVWIGFIFASLIFKLSSHSITLGMFISMIDCAASMIAISNMFSDHAHNISKEITLARLHMEFEKLPEKEIGFEEKTQEAPCIEFRGVSFRYPGSDRWILEDVSFSVTPGECLAIVGENGAGKSTAVKLICGLYRPQKGRVLIDGRDASAYSDAGIKRVLNVVFQNYERFHFTVRQNITMSASPKDAEEDMKVHAALKNAECGELCGKLDCRLGTEEGGLDLSGGQWQKLAIARALYGGGKYILLDEPTSAIDPVAENEMYECFRNVFKKRGGIMISHRLASTCVADRIIVLSKGKIIEEGTRTELMSRNGLFAKMWEVQSSWYTKGGDAGEKTV